MASNAFLTVEEWLSEGTVAYGIGRSGWDVRHPIKSIVGVVVVTCIYWNRDQVTLLSVRVWCISLSATYTLTCKKIEHWPRLDTDNAGLPIEEWPLHWTVRYVIVSKRSLVIVIDDLVSRLVSKNPVRCVQIGLEDGWT